jgi:hypothetical protein
MATAPFQLAISETSRGLGRVWHRKGVWDRYSGRLPWLFYKKYGGRRDIYYEIKGFFA